jgi:predicted DsbA family dithiol-disulfide isomerase
MAPPDTPRFYFDYVDPLSWLMDREIDAALDALEDRGTIVRVPVELRAPPAPLLDPGGAWWRERWKAATTLAEESALAEPREPTLVPWTRKAHEFVAHASEKGVGEAAHRAVFEAFFVHGRDIGRVDVLVELGRALELDPTETKVVLDVDRFAERVAAATRAAAEAAVGEPPVLVAGTGELRGFHNRDAVGTFLRR